MKHILIMETGSFKVIGGAAKDTYSIYKALKLRKDYDVDLFGSFAKIDSSIRPIDYIEFMSKHYDLIWLNSIRDVSTADSYRKSHPNTTTKFLYVDRGNVLLNFNKAKLKKLLPKMLMRRYLTARLEQWLDYYIAISVEQYEHAKSFFKGNTNVRYIMIAPHDEYRVLSTKRSFNGAITVSRLDERQKRLSFMIKGIARVKQKHPQLKDKVLLKIVGTGIDEDNYKKQVSSLGLGENIKFEGFLTGEKLIKSYNNAAFFVSTSEWEGLGRSLLEAMACGLPLLINNNINTVIKEKPNTCLVKEGYNGMVYDYGDIEEFSNKFYKVYSSRALQKKLSTNTKKFIKQFSFSRVVKSYENIIDSL